MNIYADKQEWFDAVKQLGYELSFWGYGSCDAYDDNHGLIGAWFAEFNCPNGVRPYGYLKTNLVPQVHDFNY